jgi:hypothetical protein
MSSDTVPDVLKAETLALVWLGVNARRWRRVL